MVATTTIQQPAEQKPFHVTYDGVKYDIGRFIKSHPAGEEIIRPHENQDITKTFDDVGHSKKAMKLLDKFKLDKSGKLQDDRSLSNFQFIVKKLFTDEDKFFVHKILGYGSLLSFIYRYAYVLPREGNLGFHGTTFDFFTLGYHMLLSSSSLIFHVLKQRIVDKPLIIYEEYRLHSILFTLRCVLISLFGTFSYLLENDLQRKIGLGIILLFVHGTVDYVTSKYGKEGITAVRNNNDENYKYIRLFFSYYQIVALASHVVYSGSHLEDLGYNTLIAIQSSTFLMTLRRKGLISWQLYVFWYGFALVCSMTVMYMHCGLWIFLASAAVFQIRRQNVSKYILWPVFALSYYYFEENLKNIVA